MPEHLVSIADAQGRLRLATSEDGKRLLTSDGCDRCCGPGGECATIRRYNRCAPLPSTDGCQSPPDHLWLCDKTDLAQTVKYGNSCYTRTDTTLPTASLPPGDVLAVIPDSVTVTGCADPLCTECLQYYKAEPCPGQDTTGRPGVYFLVQDVPTPAPGEDCWGTSIGGICYSVKPGPMYSRPAVEAAGGYIATPSDGPFPNFKCCTCIPACGTTIVPTFSDCGLGERTINLECCCSDEYVATVQIRAVATTIIVGAVTITDRQGFEPQTFQQGTGMPPAVLTWFQITTTTPGGTTVNQSEQRAAPTVPVCPPAALGAPGNLNSIDLTGFFAANGAPLRCPYGGPFSVTNPDGSRDEVVRADTYLTCNTFTLDYLYRRWEPSQPGTPRVEVVIRLDIRVRHTGRCGGGCGQATGQAVDGAGAILSRAVGLAVPRDQWPLWARLASALAKDGDKGIGDTIARTIGPVGGDAFKAWYQKVVGQDCGCGDRAAWLSARFPYAP